MRRRPPPPWTLTLALALVYLVALPPTTDLAAQSHRVALARDGVWLFDLSWFGGHHLPGYSVLMPVLGLVVGPGVIAAVAAVAAAAAFGRLVRPVWPGRPGTVADWWFAAGVGGLVFTGRTTFVLGAALGLATLLVARGRPQAVGTTGVPGPPGVPAPTGVPDPPGMRDPSGVPDPSGGSGHLFRRGLPGALGGVLTALASPVAALFLALAAGAWWLAGVRRVAEHRRGPVVPLLVAAAAFLAALVLSAAFPTGGSEPFVASALWPAVVVLALVLVLLPREHRTLRIGVALYLAGVVLAGVLSTPMGGNATRLAALAGGPLVAGALWGRRPVVLAVLALPLLWWQWYPPVRDATQAWADPSANAAYWAPVQRELARRVAASPGRVEVVPTARRGEARWISPAVPLARGWIRQLDRDRSPLFYDDLDGPPSARSYRAWLEDEAVSWVVLTDATPDGASEDEAALLRAGRVPGLVRAGGGAHWTLWRVVRPRGLATWASGTSGRVPTSTPRVLRTAPGSITVEIPRAGVVDLRVRWSPYLRVLRGDACLTKAGGGWTHIRAAAPATVVVGVRLGTPWRTAAPADCRAS